MDGLCGCLFLSSSACLIFCYTNVMGLSGHDWKFGLHTRIFSSIILLCLFISIEVTSTDGCLFPHQEDAAAASYSVSPLSGEEIRL